MSPEQCTELIGKLKSRFEKNINRHNDIEWSKVEEKLKSNSKKLESLSQMEITGGEPDVIGYDKATDEYHFVDCSPETPKERRNLCYDRKALDSRKSFKPADSAVDVATAMGIELLSEEQYRVLQSIGHFDAKTSSWLKTPENVRKLGGAIFGDYRFDRVFVYHNGAESYYASRGFRGLLRV
jgi:hypothetical protein